MFSTNTLYLNYIVAAQSMYYLKNKNLAVDHLVNFDENSEGITLKVSFYILFFSNTFTKCFVYLSLSNNTFSLLFWWYTTIANLGFI